MVPDPRRTSLGLEYFLWEQDAEWTWPDAQLIELGIRECTRIGLIEPSEVEDGTVVRMKKAYPVYDGNYQTSLALLQQYLGSFSNLQTVGRNGLHRYNNQDHSMLTGIYAARNIVGERNDVWSVNTEMEYHEEVRAEKPTTAGDRLIPTRVTVNVPAAVRDVSPDELIEAAFARLDPLSLGLAAGAVVGLGLFLATALLLLRGGAVIGPNLVLLGQFFAGYSVTWPGAFIGLVEGGFCGFACGFVAAWLRNWGLAAYAMLVKRRVEAEAQRDLLDKL